MTDIIKLSDASSLALHAMALLARHPQKRFPTKRMAEIFSASEHTLAKVMHELVQAGFVDSVRGASGGFSLIANPCELTVLEIHEAVDGPLVEQHCLLGKPACTGKFCVMQGLMGKLHRQLYDFFKQTTLEKLAQAIAIGD